MASGDSLGQDEQHLCIIINPEESVEDDSIILRSTDVSTDPSEGSDVLSSHVTYSKGAPEQKNIHYADVSTDPMEEDTDAGMCLIASSEPNGITTTVHRMDAATSPIDGLELIDYRRTGCCGGCSINFTKREVFEECKTILWLAWPTSLYFLLNAGINLTPIIFSGHLGTTELGAAALAVSVLGVTVKAMGMGFTTACDTFFSQTYGSANKTRMGTELQKAILCTFALVVLIVVLCLNAEVILVQLGQDPVTSAYVGSFVSLYIPAIPAELLCFILIKYLQCHSILLPIVAILLSVNAINVGCHYFFMSLLGLGFWGSPLALVVTMYLLLAHLLIFIILKGVHKHTWSGWSLQCLVGWGKFYKLGMAGSLMICFEWWSFEIGVFLADAWSRRRRRRAPVVRCSSIALAHPEYGRASCTNQNVPGSTCSYTCSSGYQLQGASSAHCQGNGVWTAVRPTCNAISCPSVSSPSHGSVSCTSGNAYRSRCTFSCSTGHNLQGSRTTTCQSNRRWSHAAPTCQVIACPSIGSLGNGYVSCTNGNIHRSKCTFDCSAGYDLQGSQNTVCGSNSRWSHAVPTCRDIRCTTLKPIPNADLQCSDSNNYMSHCVYACAEGYSIARGQFTILTCGDRGQWSATPPSCEDTTSPEIVCPGNTVLHADERRNTTRMEWETPTASDNSGDDVSVVQTMGPRYGSDAGAGNYDIVYTVTDSSGNTAQCQFTVDVIVIQCPSLYGGVGTFVDCSAEFLYGSSCTVTCDVGYIIDDPTPLTCERCNTGNNGTWSKQPPICTAVHCPELVAPDGGHFRADTSPCPTVVGSVCHIECDEDALMFGSSSRVCTAYLEGTKGYWDGEETRCEKIHSCPSLSLAPHAIILNVTECDLASGNDLPYDTMCQFGCDDGYIINGSEDITCNYTGVWSAEPPTCQVITCSNSEVPVPRNGYHAGCTHQEVEYGTTCTIGCNDGYWPTTPSEITCSSNDEGEGVWTGTIITTCEVIYPCHSPYIAPHARIANEAECDWASGERIPAGTACRYECDVGYSLDGPDSITCEYIGEWSKIPPRCQVTMCNGSAIDVPENGYKYGCSNAEVVYGATCRIGCKYGYAPSTVSEVTCTVDERGIGVWNGTVISACEEIECPAPVPPSNGVIQKCTLNDVNTTLTDPQRRQTICVAACDQGFMPHGPTDRRCLTIGRWNGNPLKCIADCKPGSYLAASGNCTNCSVGYYQPEEGKTFCTKCQEGTTTPRTGSTSREECRQMNDDGNQPNDS